MGTSFKHAMNAHFFLYTLDRVQKAQEMRTEISQQKILSGEMTKNDRAIKHCSFSSNWKRGVD
jgi:hypothetical protein